jgi:hypothetical protein
MSGGQEGRRLQSEITGFCQADGTAAKHSVAAAHVMLLTLLPRGAPAWPQVHCSDYSNFSFANKGI